ncbi:MAG: hypothetical protein GF393_00330 [Armatimonadia bacterium]|nr:hypothetical protein [Armatimonadia bacterium]
MLRVVLIALLLAGAAANVYPEPKLGPEFAEDTAAGFVEDCEYAMGLPEPEMLALVPEKTGMVIIGCPNCPPSRPEGRFDWDPRQPERITCQLCGHSYPSADYPDEHIHEVTTPAGNTVTYRFWERDDGYRYYLGACVAKQQQLYMVDMARKMAHIYHYTGEQRYARRSALIINRFAEVYPDYIYKFELPYRQKILYDGQVDPTQEKGWRTSRWGWWGYKDIPDRLIRAYDLIRGSDELKGIPGVAERIIHDFFLVAAEGVRSQEDTYHNKSPEAYRDMLVVGRVLERPEYVHEVVDRMQAMCTRRFFYDGSWYEGAPSYHRQVLNGFGRIFDLARGYFDPENYAHPDTGRRLDDLDLEALVPEVQRATAAYEDMRMPNGRLAPLHDTWAHTSSDPLEESEPILFGGLGHAILGRGSGENQTQLHLAWSGAWGHRHYDGLSMFLFAKGREMLSDLGYTHTRYDGYKRATVAHNTVTVDMQDQYGGGEAPCSEGRLLFYDAADPDVQVVRVANTTCYPELAERYERTMALIAIDEADCYAVDCFIVKSPRVQDYFIHGSADDPQSVGLLADGEPVPMTPVQSMVPADLDWQPPVNADRQGLIKIRGWPYGLLWDNQSATRPAGVVQARFEYDDADLPTRVFLVTGEKDTVFTGTDPQIRPADENDAIVDQFKRPHVILRRPGGDAPNAFISVIEPASGEGRIRAVSVIATSGEGTALRIDGDGFTDIIALHAADLEGSVGGLELRADGLLSHLRLREGELERAYTTARVHYGDAVLISDVPDGVRAAGLLSVDRFGGRGALTLDADWTDPAPEPGTVLIVDHGDGHAHGYHVQSVEAVPMGTRIVLADEPGFEFDADNATAQFLFHPRYTRTGEHRVVWHRPARMPER